MGRIRTLILLAGILLPLVASPLKIRVTNDTAFVFIQVGQGEYIPGVTTTLVGTPTGGVDQVSFTFPPGVQPGDNTPIVGTPAIPVIVLGTNAGVNLANYSLTANSSAGLINGNGETLLFSEFSWTTQDGDINGGRFDDSANQPLQTFLIHGARGRGFIDYLTFTYDNDTIYPAGSYTGRVVYTVTEL